MNKDDTLKAVDAAFLVGVNRLYEVFVQGLQIGTAPDTLEARFQRGLASNLDAYGKIRTIVEDYFNGKGE
jgi:hypothetical protein